MEQTDTETKYYSLEEETVEVKLQKTDEKRAVDQNFVIFRILANIYGYSLFAKQIKSHLAVKIIIGIWLVFLSLLICWHFIGWSLNVVSSLVFMYMKSKGSSTSHIEGYFVIPGFYEISVNKGFTGFVGLFLSFCSVYSLIIWLYSTRGGLVEQMLLKVNETATKYEYLEAATKKYLVPLRRWIHFLTFLSVFYGLICTLIGIIINSTRGFYGQIIAEKNGWLVAFDITITIFSYFVQFTLLMLVASRLFIQCELHKIQMKIFVDLLIVEKKLDKIEGAMSEHVEIKKELARSSKLMARYLSVYSAAVFLAIILQMYSIISMGVGEIWIRFIFCAIFAVPLTIVWVRCAQVAQSSLDLISKVSNTTSSAIPFESAQEATRFQHYILLWKEIGNTCFEVFGMQLDYVLFFRVYYLLITAIALLLQRQITQASKKTQ